MYGVLRHSRWREACAHLPGYREAGNESSNRMTGFDVVVIGAGPAGMAAAAAAAKHGAKTCLIDDNVRCGGQIWRGHDRSEKQAPEHRFVQLQMALKTGHVEMRDGAYVVAFPSAGVLRIETRDNF